VSVKVNLHPGLLHFTHDQVIVEVKGNTVGECLDGLAKQFPQIKPMLFDKQGRLLKYVDVYVNHESAYPEELAKPVKDGDELHITLTIAGG
jgi:molybdopterin converting factor small subunit